PGGKAVRPLGLVDVRNHARQRGPPRRTHAIPGGARGRDPHVLPSDESTTGVQDIRAVSGGRRPREARAVPAVVLAFDGRREGHGHPAGPGVPGRPPLAPTRILPSRAMEHDEYRRMFEEEDRYWWFLAKRALVRSLVERYAPRPSAVALDVGCGTGGTL